MPKIFRKDKESIYSNWEDNTLYKYLEDYVEAIGAADADSDELTIIYSNGDDPKDLLEKLEKFQTE